MTKEFSTILDDFDGGAAQSEGTGFQLDIKRLLVLRAPLIVGVAFVLAVPAMIAGWFLTPVVYTATGQIRYSMVRQTVTGTNTSASQPNYTSFVDTEIRQLSGPNILNLVLDEYRDENLALTLESFIGVKDEVNYLMGAIRARRLGASELVAVTCTLPVRKESQEVLTTLMNIYVEKAREDDLKEEKATPGSRMDLLLKVRKGLEETLERQQNEVTAKENLLAALSVSAVPERYVEADRIDVKILDTQEALKGFEGQESDAKEKLDKLNTLKESSQRDPGAPIWDYGINQQLNTNQRVMAARAQEHQAKMVVDEKAGTQRETNPILENAIKRHALSVKNVEYVKREVLGEILEERRAVTEDEHERIAKRIEETEARLATYEKDSERIESERQKRTAAYVAAESNYAREQSALDFLKSEAQETQYDLRNYKGKITDLARNSRAASRIEKAEDASVPQTQDYKRKIMYVLLGFCGACAGGLGAGILRELSDQQFRSPRDFSRVTQLPVVGSLPDAAEDPALDGAEHALLTSQHAGSRSADEFRRILTRILYPEESGAEVNSLLVVSPSRGDGKTSVASNLAIALGNSKRRVLLVDINAQRPDLEGIFGFKRGPGLSELLDGVYDREELVRPAPYDNVSILGPGLDGAGLASRLASREMVEFLEWADGNYDHTIIDTPAILLMSDAKLLAPTVDAVMVVVGAGITNFGMLRRCLDDLEHLHANVIGLILNRTRRLRGGYMHKNLELYYAYAFNELSGVQEDLPEMEIIDTPDELEEAVVLLPYGDKEEADGRKV